MAIRNILKMGEPLLFQESSLVSPSLIATDEIQSIIQDLLDTMTAANGAGLAAPQIGVPLQIVVFGFEKNNRYPNEAPVPQTILINPIITPLSDEKVSGWEGCLSVPGLRGVVPRFLHIRYQGFDQHGNSIDRQVSGFHARVVQHECDHLIGKLYPMRVEDLTQFGFTEVLFPDL
ncbi:MAG: peptide deformylase [Betaproteobacteria bacterium]